MQFNVTSIEKHNFKHSVIILNSNAKITTNYRKKLIDKAVTYKLSEHLQALPPQNVHAFLPLRSYGFKFLIQADFEVPSSREDIDRDSLWNQEVLKEIPRLVIDAFKAFLVSSRLHFYFTWHIFLKSGI